MRRFADLFRLDPLQPKKSSYAAKSQKPDAAIAAKLQAGHWKTMPKEKVNL
jgi:hypothetical protein